MFGWIGAAAWICLAIAIGSCATEREVAVAPVTNSIPTNCIGPNQAWLPVFGDTVSTDTPAIVTTIVDPVYPPIALEAGVDGHVFLNVLVCRTGLPATIQVSKSIPMLDQAAIDAVKQWRFAPASKDGAPVAVWVTIPITFTLPPPARRQ